MTCPPCPMPAPSRAVRLAARRQASHKAAAAPKNKHCAKQEASSSASELSPCSVLTPSAGPVHPTSVPLHDVRALQFESDPAVRSVRSKHSQQTAALVASIASLKMEVSKANNTVVQSALGALGAHPVQPEPQAGSLRGSHGHGSQRICSEQGSTEQDGHGAGDGAAAVCSSEQGNGAICGHHTKRETPHHTERGSPAQARETPPHVLRYQTQEAQERWREAEAARSAQVPQPRARGHTS